MLSVLKSVSCKPEAFKELAPRPEKLKKIEFWIILKFEGL